MWCLFSPPCSFVLFSCWVGGGDPSPEVRGLFCRIPWPRLGLVRWGASPGRLLWWVRCVGLCCPLHGDWVGSLVALSGCSPRYARLLAAVARDESPAGPSLASGLCCVVSLDGPFCRAGECRPIGSLHPAKAWISAGCLSLALSHSVSRGYSATNTEICTPTRSTHTLAQASIRAGRPPTRPLFCFVCSCFVDGAAWVEPWPSIFGRAPFGW